MTIFTTNIINLYGDQGKVWLRDLPKIIHKLAKEWDLSALKVACNLTYHYVLSGFQKDQPIILKLGLDIEGLKQEAEALTAFTGFGVVRVLGKREGALLLERVSPGVSLTSYFPEKGDEAILITCNVMKKLHQAPLVGQFASIENWLCVLDKDLEIPNYYLQKAHQLKETLLKTSTEPVLLHGDLHHDNILQKGSEWVVIDPKGVIGEGAYEVGAFIRNPIPDLLALENAPSILTNRFFSFSKELNLDIQRIKHWCFVQAVLAWVWALEDGADPDYFKRLTEFFDHAILETK